MPFEFLICLVFFIVVVLTYASYKIYSEKYVLQDLPTFIYFRALRSFLSKNFIIENPQSVLPKGCSTRRNPQLTTSGKSQHRGCCSLGVSWELQTFGLWSLLRSFYMWQLYNTLCYNKKLISRGSRLLLF